MIERRTNQFLGAGIIFSYEDVVRDVLLQGPPLGLHDQLPNFQLH